LRKKRVAIACQGGGSQCAFVAGALATFFRQGVDDRYRIVGLSGTSGGALTSAVAWYGMLLRSHGDPTPIEDRILALWKDLTAQTPQEILFDGLAVQLVRLTERGWIPSLATSPSSLRFQVGSQMLRSFIPRLEFTDLGVLVNKHIDFDALSSLVEQESPVLLAGAADVLRGTFKIFSSSNGEIKLDALLASAAIPNLFPAVWVDGHAYWDGIFSSNPPVVSFLQRDYMGKHAVPEEIWVIQVNRAEHESVPDRPADIFDRRNHLAGNLSLQHELQLIAMVNLLILEDALSDQFRSRFGLETREPISVRFVRMSESLQRGLDYPSKLSRQPDHIDSLIADGEAQAAAFLDHIGEADSRPEPLVEGAPAEIH
jgi:NTE family protein